MRSIVLSNATLHKRKFLVISNEKLTSLILLFAILSSTLMLPFSIFINYGCILFLFFFGRKLDVEKNITPIILLSTGLIFFSFRESVSSSGSPDGLKYFLSSFFWQISYIGLIAFKRPSVDDITTMLLWSAFIQSLIIFARLIGLFQFPVPGGILDSNAGLVSFHQREQISAVSMSISLFVWGVYGKTSVIKIAMYSIAMFSVLFTGSTGALIALLLVFATRLISEYHYKISFSNFLYLICAITLFSISINHISDNIGDFNLEGFSTREVTQMVVDLASGGEWFYYKLFEANTRVEILSNYFKLASNDVVGLLLGFTKSEWMVFNNGNGELGSPHSLFLELFIHGGVFFGIYFVLFIFRKFIYRIGFIKGLLYLSAFLIISIINSNNMASPLLAVILMLTSRHNDELSVK